MADAEPMMAMAAPAIEQTLALLRGNGWMVAVHNDYVLNGKAMTFWLFTHSEAGRFIKGEGVTDAEALERCVDSVKALKLRGL